MRTQSSFRVESFVSLGLAAVATFLVGCSSSSSTGAADAGTACSGVTCGGNGQCVLESDGTPACLCNSGFAASGLACVAAVTGSGGTSVGQGGQTGSQGGQSGSPGGVTGLGGNTGGNISGELSGLGGDGTRYNATWEGGNRLLSPVPYYIGGIPYFHFTLDSQPWPSADWGIRWDSWSATCTNGGQLVGIGGDGNSYSAQWNTAGQILQPSPYYLELGGTPYFHFTLDSQPWPSADWGVLWDSWTVTCN
jgi:hypothetical protein